MPSPLLPVVEADRLLALPSTLHSALHSGGLVGPSGCLTPEEDVLLEEAAGRILRADIRADRAYPAQDRSRMDGVALRGDDLALLSSSACPVAGLARAGDARLDAPPRGSCVEIMTGAALPRACDTVVPYEDVDLRDGVATLRADARARIGQNVHPEGSDCAAGAVLVPRGVRLQAAHVAIAASVGMTMLRVARRLRAAVVATGDELVGVEYAPLAHQLRVSNAHGLAALLAPWADARVQRVGDDPARMTAVLRAALADSDLVLVSGGVSAGKFDAVPAVLESLGVRKVFHKLAQKPGKPLWFGMFGAFETPGGRPVPPENAPPVPVFGLPGNPVSALVCARRFVLPLLWERMGWAAPRPPFVPLASAVDGPSSLTRFLPVRLEQKAVSIPGSPGASAIETVAAPRAVNGSGDFATLGASDGFLELPPSEKHYPAGTQMAFFAWVP